jgi:SAM-dependent methyltransferase
MSYEIAWEPKIVPTPELMSLEIRPILEEWFRWGDEWSFILRAHGGARIDSSVLEIGCGLGRIAYALRWVIFTGTYRGFDIVRQKIEFLTQQFTPEHPNFEFAWADLANTCFNPNGALAPSAFDFPYSDEQFDLVFAASVFTHMVPENTQRYFREASRVLKPGGKFVASFFLLDNFDPARPRPPGFFSSPDFDFKYQYKNTDGFAISSVENPEFMTAYSTGILNTFCRAANLKVI